jgi:hypothetical protein
MNADFPASESRQNKKKTLDFMSLFLLVQFIDFTKK